MLCRYPEVVEEPADLALDLVADGADIVDGLAGGVVQGPVEVPRAGEDRAGVAAAHGDDDVGGAGSGTPGRKPLPDRGCCAGPPRGRFPLRLPQLRPRHLPRPGPRPRHRADHRPPWHGTGLGTYRWVAERAFAWLHGFRRLRIRGTQI